MPHRESHRLCFLISSGEPREACPSRLRRSAAVRCPRHELTSTPEIQDARVSRQAGYEMRDRPLAIGVQALAANRLELRWLRARVVSVKEKARQTCQVRVGKTSASEPLMKRRNCKLASEPRCACYLGISVGDTCLLPTRRPALRWRESDSGSYLELENLSSRCQGRSPSGSPTRIRVPMRGTGAEWSAVAMRAV
jgi:hypothetical protein